MPRNPIKYSIIQYRPVNYGAVHYTWDSQRDTILSAIDRRAAVRASTARRSIDRRVARTFETACLRGIRIVHTEQPRLIVVRSTDADTGRRLVPIPDLTAHRLPVEEKCVGISCIRLQNWKPHIHHQQQQSQCAERASARTGCSLIQSSAAREAITWTAVRKLH